jgi:hypothetical protein
VYMNPIYGIEKREFERKKRIPSRQSPKTLSVDTTFFCLSFLLFSDV